MATAEVLLAHDIPVAFAARAVPTQMCSFEVVERGASAGIVITASHNPWVDNGFKVKAPTGAAAGADILGVIESRLATNGETAIDRRPFADAEAAGLVERFDPYDGYERFVRRTVDLDALKAADASILVDPMWGAGARLAVATPGRRPVARRRGPPGAQPVLRGRQPGADPTEHRRGARASSPVAATTSACSSTATRIGPAPPTSAARSSTSSQVTGLLMYTWQSIAGCASRSSSASTTRRWPPAWASTTGSPSTRHRSASSSSGRR